MSETLGEKIKIFHVLREYLEDNIAIVSEMNEAETMEEMKVHLKELVQLNEGLLSYLQKETEVLAEQASAFEES